MRKEQSYLSEEQIERLFAFVRSCSVKHYDVQVELVDHLATAIEEKLEDNPEKSFQEAFWEVHRSFGPLGFTDFVQSKTKAVNKHALRLWWKEFVLWFSWPKMVLTLGFILGVYLLLETVRIDFVIYGANIFFIALFLIYIRNGKRRVKLEKGYSLLTIEPFNAAFGSFYVIGYIPYILTQHGAGSAMSMTFPMWSIWVLALWFTFGFLYLTSSFAVRKRVLEKSEKLYPEIFVKTA